MLTSLARKVFGTANERFVRSLQPLVQTINGLEKDIAALSDNALRAKTAEFRTRLQEGVELDKLLPEAFAVVREAAKRALNMRHFDVQLIGGMVLHRGMISEMKTGEGKTLVATLPVYLNALTGKGVHVVTVNDYLAKRDSEWMGNVYKFLGLSVGVIVHGMTDEERQQAYGCDITYGTNNEYGFDYLRDNMKYSRQQMVQRPFNFAIVDEVDSILIDEARTPLIISGPTEDNSELYTRVDKLMPKLAEDDYEKDEKARTVTLTEKGVQHMEELLIAAGLLTPPASLFDLQSISVLHHVNQALKAHKMFTRDVDYIVKDNRVIIIDEFTGRMMEGRRYSEGLHQALEAKEGVKIQNENQTLASITFQNYFRLYPKLAGMTGTAMTEAAEFRDIYGLEVVDIPTHMPVARMDEHDEIYRTAKEKYDAVIKLIKERHEKKQPMLVGTVSIEKSEYLSSLLKKAGVPHQVLNARYHEKEAYIIAQAGRPGAVTIATNMAGRGTDIMLGGNPEMLIKESLPHTSGSPLEGEQPTPSEAKGRRGGAVSGTQTPPHDVSTPASGLETSAPSPGGGMEQKIRNEVQAAKEEVIAAGGLFVIGTERHESRRIDNQLRGRSGRQGDPGASKFFLSLEDDLMRIFGSERIDTLLQKFGLKEGEAIFHPWMNRAIEKAQQKVEARNYDIRKNLLKFDDVMNDQRKVIYEQRLEMIDAEDVQDAVRDMRTDIIREMVTAAIPPGSYHEKWDLVMLSKEIFRIFGLHMPVEDWAKEEGIAEDEIQERIQQAVEAHMQGKESQYGPRIMRSAEKQVLLQTLDQLWKDHLLSLDHLRHGINLRAYGQRDPLNEYKQEAFSLFEAMLNNLRETVTTRLSHLEVRVEVPEHLEGYRPKQRMFETRNDPAMGDTDSIVGEQERQAPVRTHIAAADRDPNDPSTWGKIARNESCPCGSGKKYKHCHGEIV